MSIFHDFVNEVRAKVGKDTFSTSEVKAFKKTYDITVPQEVWGCRNANKKIDLNIVLERIESGEFQDRELHSRGKSKDNAKGKKKEKVEVINNNTVLPDVPEVEVLKSTPSVITEVQPQTSGFDIEMYIPKRNKSYVAAGDNYKIIKNIIESGEFFPAYIYGVSGIGKTSSIEDICAVLKKPFFRVQITPETIDDDLIGCMKLVDGNTVWQDGPILTAYRCGGVVVLDEVDLNSNLMILQGILEKKPFFVKQTGELVHPTDGFTVFATGNTKGDGTDSRFVGTQVLNEAFLDRFGITLQQKFLSKAEELRVAKKYCSVNNIDIDQALLGYLIEWANTSRTVYESQPDDNVYISTRRIRFILKAYKMFNDIEKAIEVCISRFSEEHASALKLLWSAVVPANPVVPVTDADSDTQVKDATVKNYDDVPLNVTTVTGTVPYNAADITSVSSDYMSNNVAVNF